MDEILKKYVDSLDMLDIMYEPDVPLSEHTSFRIGGNADVGVYPDSESQLTKAIGLAKKNGIRYMVAGNGSNLLFDDAGYRGAVIFTKKICDISVNGTVISAGAGASLLAVASVARKSGLSGIEFAYGIPGSCGGAVCMNAGAYGGELADVVKTVTLYDSECDDIVKFENKDMCFSYRKSIVGNGERYTVLSVDLQLEAADVNAISEKMNEFMRRRVEKQPLNYPSAGSVFKRSAPDVYVGKMIEESGLKGYSVGGAEVSKKHAGFIVNRGGATSHDVCLLIEHIQNTIFKNYGIRLECEIRRIPEKQ